jgi:hypothetical protein
MIPEGTYQDSFTIEGHNTETALETARPRESKPVARKNCLFVFEDFAHVESYWNQHNGLCLYEVETEETSVIHRGDMELVDQIGKEFRQAADHRRSADHELVANLANQYWSGFLSGQPRLDVLVRSAKVINKRQGPSDTTTYLYEHGRIPRFDPTDEPSDEEFLNRLNQANDSDDRC